MAWQVEMVVLLIVIVLAVAAPLAFVLAASWPLVAAAWLILIGLMFAAGWSLVTVKLLMLLYFLAAGREEMEGIPAGLQREHGIRSICGDTARMARKLDPPRTHRHAAGQRVRVVAALGG